MDCKIRLEATQVENKTNQQKKNKVSIESLKKDHKEFIKNNHLILKSKQRFRSENMTYLLKKIIILHWVITVMKEYNQ